MDSIVCSWSVSAGNLENAIFCFNECSWRHHSRSTILKWCQMLTSLFRWCIIEIFSCVSHTEALSTGWDGCGRVVVVWAGGGQNHLTKHRPFKELHFAAALFYSLMLGWFNGVLGAADMNVSQLQVGRKRARPRRGGTHGRQACSRQRDHPHVNAGMCSWFFQCIHLNTSAARPQSFYIKCRGGVAANRPFSFKWEQKGSSFIIYFMK